MKEVCRENSSLESTGSFPLEDTETVLGEQDLTTTPRHWKGSPGCLEQVRWKEHEGLLGADCTPWSRDPKEIGSAVPPQQEIGFRQPGSILEAFLCIFSRQKLILADIQVSEDPVTWSWNSDYGIVS